jgi:hypothetical protein
MDESVRQYLAAIGQRGGEKSRRKLSREAAQTMVRIREARRAYKNFYAKCFWSYDPNLHIGADDIAWVAERLMKAGNREAWQIGAGLCR